MEIPISEAENLSKKYGYEQIIILAQKESSKENWFDNWVTTFNKDKQKCSFLGKVGSILIYNMRAFYSNEKMTTEYCLKLKDRIKQEQE